MPVSKSIIVSVPALSGNGITNRNGKIIDGTQKCLAVVIVGKGFTVNHILSGCCIGSNDDNLFLSRRKAGQWGLKFWNLLTPLSVATYKKEKDPKLLRAATNTPAKLFATKRTNRAKSKK